MFKAIKRWWKYLTAKVSGSLDARADPKVQLEQAISEARKQHKELREQAASVIANQKQAELKLNRQLEALEEVNDNTQQALKMADQATKTGEAEKAEEYTSAAEAFAERLVSMESEIDDLKELVLQSAQAADQAKAAVNQNSSALQKKLSEKQKLLGQLDQAKMQEQVNDAMASLSETVGDDVPTLDEVREKIEARYAKAKGMGELAEGSVETRMAEIEQASRNADAKERLAQMRTQLGIGAGDDAAGG